MAVRYFDAEIQGLSGDSLILAPTVTVTEDEVMGKEVRVEIVPKPGLMEPASLSASAALKFENCEAGFRSDYIDRVPSLGGNAGLQGNAVHEALEFWIQSGQYLKFADQTMQVREGAMRIVWDMAYWNYFSDKSFYQSGWEMLLKWLQRESWDGRSVIEVEVKKSFEIATSKGPLTFNYILDRKDRLDNGEIEVVDYKTVARPVTAEDMRNRIQPRAYGLAMFIEHKDEEPEGVWVTYDLLRYTPVSVYFTRADCEETYRYLQALAERIYKSNGTQETLNPECRFCTRATVCETLRKHAEFGGPMSVTSLEEASDRLAVLENAKGGLDAAITALKDIALEFAEDEGVMEWSTLKTSGKVTAKGRREVDSERIAKIVGPEIMARYGTLGVGIVEKMLQEETSLTDSQRSQIKQYITKKFGKAYVDVKPLSPFEED